MKMKLLTLLLSMLMPSSVVFAQTAKPEIQGMTYHSARAVIIEQGWKPRQTQTDNQERYGNGDFFWLLGYRELSACSGTGEALCGFTWVNENGELLKISTYGEETDQYHAVVRSAIIENGQASTDKMDKN